jgi:acyl carrier protein
MIEKKIKKVMANVFNTNIDDISEETSTDTLSNWNSLGHMTLVVALEEEFGIEFQDEDVIEMNSYPLLVCIIKEMTQNQAV